MLNFLHYIMEVRTEIHKIFWCPLKETLKIGVLVLIILAIIAISLFIVDNIVQKIIDFLFKI